ncbi:uncharacterized protein A1O5_13337 [Cladophialophora psammophila CBS 110553]|uniref:Protein SYM1 n=1 Tax=Cladophialophora psammophila CBS 110553 TaxID=1182543 RepID=W9VD76_9EURO|nr:uncharacterized protein A1O5_13337 [Cladophialophora psammophila CBS 110553]EXJ53403.1 hypothetical protein A1O5_13337 [Cladophialophora psammophila CBS 110553]
MAQRLVCICRRGIPPRHRRFSRNVFTKDQVKTAGLEKTPHTPNQVVTEVPQSTEPSVIDVPSPLCRIQRRRPLGIALGTSLTTYLCGDLLAQEVGGEPYDGRRTLRMIIVGSLASIPGYKWFLFLGSHFNYASKWVSIVVKVVIQEFFFAPIFNTYFFGMKAMLSGESPPVIIHRIVSTVPESVVSSAKFWPAVTAMNFTLVPAHLRFAFSGFFAVIWQTYLSYLNRREEKTAPQGTLADQARQKLYDGRPFSFRCWYLGWC